MYFTIVFFITIALYTDNVMGEDVDNKFNEKFILRGKKEGTRKEDSKQVSMVDNNEILHIPNTYCRYYAYGGDGPCTSGRPFNDVWSQCSMDGPEKCMGVMWNSCGDAPTSDTSVNGAWKLITAGQDIGDADHPTDTCGGKDQALGHWDVFIYDPKPPMVHIPNTYCEYYASGGDGPCTSGRSFNDVWGHCSRDGPERCMGVMWNSCGDAAASDTSVPGAWALMTPGQDIGDADHPTDTCGGSDVALGEWDVFARSTDLPSSAPSGSGNPVEDCCSTDGLVCDQDLRPFCQGRLMCKFACGGTWISTTATIL